MSDENDSGQVVIRARDLAALAVTALLRLPSAEGETERTRSVCRVLDAARRLSQVLEMQTRYTLVDHRGTPGTNDLPGTSRALFDALTAYAVELRHLTQRYGPTEPAVEVKSNWRIAV